MPMMMKNSPRRSRSVFSLACLWLIGCLFSELPAADLYWTDRGTGLVQRSTLIGGDVETLVTMPAGSNLRGLSLDVPQGVLYFADNGSDTIYRAQLDGSEREALVTGLGFPADVELDAVNRRLYWCDQQTNQIQRANLDGTSVETVLATDAPYFMELDLPTHRIYWGHFSNGTIYRASLNGNDQETLVTGLPRVRAVKLDSTGTYLYWCDREAHKVQRKLLEGGAIEDIYTGLDTPHGMTLDYLAQKVYWADTGTNRVPGSTGGQAVCRGDLDGRDPIEVLVELSQPWDLDLDPTIRDYDDWVGRFFHRTTSRTAPEDDADGDGFENLLEYALGSHPDRGVSLPAYEAVWVKGADGEWLPEFRYTRFRETGDLSYQLEVSEDAQTWNYQGDGSGIDWIGPEEAEVLEEGLERVRVPFFQSTRFVRLRVQLQEPQ